MTSSKTLPSVSVVMPSYNLSRFIRESIDSVLDQRYPFTELIVVDGASTDGTIDILKSYGDKIQWVSEKDKGQSDALNKGFRMSKGDIVTWLNSDDLYEPDSLRKVGEYFAANPQTQWIFGHCSIINEHGNEIRKLVSQYKARRLRQYSYSALLSENFISQMGVFMRRQAVLDSGGIDASRHYAMDYDLWLRLGKKYPPGFINERLGKFRMYATTKSVSGFRKQFAEDLDVAIHYANGSYWPVLLHRINNLKIVTAYELMAFFQRLKKGCVK